jgi:hypothetical protein
MATADPELPDEMLLGREREIDSCDTLLAARSGTLLLRGPPGIGKTSLLETAGSRAQALGFRVLRTAGSEAETRFAFAGLQPLLLPLLDARTEMPEHLRTALLSALGLLDVEVPGLESVGLAVLSLLGGVADTGVGSRASGKRARGVCGSERAWRLRGRTGGVRRGRAREPGQRR